MQLVLVTWSEKKNKIKVRLERSRGGDDSS